VFSGEPRAVFFNTTSGGNGAQIYKGDSGGPWLRGAHQVGLNSTLNTISALSRRPVNWIVSNHLGRLYLRPYVSLSRGMKWWGQAWEANVTAEMAAADYFHWWEYNWQTREIRAASAADGVTCLDLKYNNPADNTPIWMWGCNSGDAQKWIITPQFQIKSEVHNKCIELVNLAMVIKPCVSGNNSQKWVWDTDSRVPNWY
jgi:hypothetical protein